MYLFDLHCDTIVKCYDNEDRTLRKGPDHLSLDLMKKHGGMGQVFAISVAWRQEKAAYDAYEEYSRIFRFYRDELEKNRDVIRPVYSWEDLRENRDAGYLSAVAAMEGAEPLEGQIGRIEEFYSQGLRLITLTWNYPNELGYPHSSEPELHRLGLTENGLEAVAAMNRLGMIIDVSHLSEGGFYDVARNSGYPFIASHSCARELCGHSRNLTDAQLRTLGECGGVAGVNFYSRFLREGSDCTTVQDILRHVDHMVNKAGIEHVAFGSDFDGIDSAGELVDYSGYDHVIAGLEKKYSDDKIDLLTHGNALRVMKDVLRPAPAGI